MYLGLLHVETCTVIAQEMWCILEIPFLPLRKILEEKKKTTLLGYLLKIKFLSCLRLKGIIDP